MENVVQWNARGGWSRWGTKPLLRADVRPNVPVRTGPEDQRSAIVHESESVGEQRLEIRAENLLVLVEDDPRDALEASGPCQTPWISCRRIEREWCVPPTFIGHVFRGESEQFLQVQIIQFDIRRSMRIVQQFGLMENVPQLRRSITT